MDMNVNVVLPYQNAKSQYKIWANEEEDIDFRSDFDRADRCTICFAAVELETHLGKCGGRTDNGEIVVFR